MVKLDDPVWKTVSSAGNDADKWLQVLTEGKGDIRETIEIVAEDLSHQLSWYSATAYALPHLAALCGKLSKEDQVFLIAQMGAAIAAEAVCPLVPDTQAYLEFQEGLEGLGKEAKPLITDPDVHDLLNADGELGSMFALGALAVLGDRSHAYDLWYLSGSTWEEGYASCVCGWRDEEIPLTEQPECIEPFELDAWDKMSLDNEAVWLNGLLELAGDTVIAPVLPLLYGEGTCPECGRREPYWTWLDRYREEM